jgi:ferredoxin
MKRKIIRIDESKCNGCELCLPNCPEGAIQMIEGKARLISDLFCDGLGACLGHCPEGAITIEEREAAPYDERAVMAVIVKQGQAVIHAHLQHLKEHGEENYLRQALEYLREQGIEAGFEKAREATNRMHSGCPGAQVVALAATAHSAANDASPARPSHLTHWPIQLHLLSPLSPHFHDSDLLLAADCVAFSMGDFHKDYLQGKTLAIACPKLDDGQDTYLDKLTALIDDAKIRSLTVMIMQVPCCSGLLRLSVNANARATRKVPVHYKVISLKGDILQDGTANA